MTWSKPFEESELDYIRESWPSSSCAEIAEHLGRSRRGVENAVNRLGLRASCAPRARARDAHRRGAGRDAPDDGQDELAELRELKEVLKESMGLAGPSAMPRLSAEYREVLARISELEGGSGDSGGNGGNSLAGLIGFVPIQPA